MALAAGPLQFPIVLAFCTACALLIAWLIDRGASQADTAIGIVLVGAMTLGAVLIQWAASARTIPIPGWESILFGSIVAVDRVDAATAWAVTAGILAVLWAVRRPLLFWAFDEAAAPAFGVPAAAMKYLLVVLLTIAIVTAMKLAGVVLATALLVLPGAAALRLSDRLSLVLLLSVGAGLVGVLGGLVLSFESGVLPPGACIVTVLLAVLILTRAAKGVQSARERP
jgi:ABC-type Mn2+/Zn2+ transport system permease subunit